MRNVNNNHNHPIPPFAKPYIHKTDDNDDCKSQPHFVLEQTPELGVEINLLVNGYRGDEH